MDSAVRTGTRLRPLLVRLLVTAGFMVAAWLLGSLMATSASASTCSDNDASPDADHSSNPGLLGGVGGAVDGLTHTVGDVVGDTTGTHDPADNPSDSDHATGSNNDSNANTSYDTLPDLVPGLVSSSRSVSTSPATTTKQPAHEAARNDSRAAATKTTSKPQTVRTHRPVAKSGHDAEENRRPKKSPGTDHGRRTRGHLPPTPPAPQAPPAPSTTINVGHDTAGHGKNGLAVAAGEPVLAPPTTTGIANDHRATAVDQNHGRPATAPD